MAATVIETLLVEIQARDGEAKLQQLKRALGATGEEAGRFEKKTDSASKAQGRFAQSISGVDRAIMGQLAQLAAMGAAFLGVQQAIAQIGGSLKAFEEFEQKMSSVRAVGELTRAQMEELSKVALKLGADTAFSASQAAEGMELFGQAGFKTSEIVAAMPGLLDLAASGQLGLAQAADVSTSIMKGFGLQAAESGRVADVLAVAAAKSNTTVAGLGEGMKYVAPIAASLGLSLEDTAAAMGVLSDAGIKDTMAGTALRRNLADLVNPATEARKAIAALGLDYKELSPATHSYVEIVDQLAKVHLDAASAFKIFGDAGAPSILALVAQRSHLAQFTEEMHHTAGASREMAKTLLDNLAGSQEQLSGSIDTVRIKFGEAMSEGVRPAYDLLTQFFNDNGENAKRWGQAVGEAVLALVKAFLFLAQNTELVAAAAAGLAAAWLALKLGPMIVSTYQYVAALVSLAASEGVASVATMELSVAWDRLTAAMARNPVGLIAVALALLVSAVVYLALKHREAAKEAEEYNRRLEEGKPKIEGVARAHDEVVAALDREIARRKELSEQVNASRERLEQLEPVLEQMKAALARGDTAAYDKAVASAQKLGVVLEGMGRQSSVSVVESEVRALHAELDSAATGLEDNADRMALARQKLAEGIEQAVSDEVTTLVDLKSSLADNERKAADLQRQLAELSSGNYMSEGASSMFVKLAAELGDVQLAAERAQKGIEDLEQRRSQMKNDAIGGAGNLIAQGEYERGSKLLRFAGVDEKQIEFIVEQQKKYNAGAKERTALEDAAKRKAEEAQRAARAAANERTKQQENELKRFQELAAQLEAQAKGQHRIAEAYKISVIAGRAMEEQVEAEGKANQAAAKFEGAHEKAIRDRVAAEIAAERQTKGEQVIAGLRERIKAQQALTTALRSGSAPAAEEARRKDELLAQVFENTAGVADSLTGTIGDLTAQLFNLGKGNEALAQGNALDLELRDLQDIEDQYRLNAAGVGALLEQQRIEAAVLQETAGKFGDEAAAIERNVRAREKRRKEVEQAGRVQSIFNDLSLSQAVGGIDASASDHVRVVEEQYLGLLRDLGSGSIQEGQKVMNALAAKFGWTMDQVKDALGQLADAAKIRELQSGGRTSLDNYRRDQAELLRLQEEAAKQGKDITVGTQAQLNANTQRFWDEQLVLWASALGFLAEHFGGFFAELANLVNGLQQARQFGQSVQGAVGGLTNNASLAATAGGIATVVGVFAVVYDFVDKMIKKSKSVKYGAEAGFSLVGGEVGTTTLSQTAIKVVNAIKDVVQQIGDALGGTITDLADIGIRIRNDGKYVAAYVHGIMIGHFESVDDAIRAAINQAIVSGDFKISGISDLVRQGLASWTAPDFDSMMKFLQQLRQISDLGKTQGQLSMEATIRSLDDLWRALSHLHELTPAVAQGFANLTAAEADAWQSWRNSITGHQETAQEQTARLQREGALFDATKAMRLADLKLRKLDLEQQLADLKARGHLIAAGGQLHGAELQGDANYLKAKGELVKAELSLYEQTLIAIQASIDAIAATIAAIEAIPDIAGNIKLPRSGGRGAGAGESPTDRLLGMVADSSREQARSSMTDLGRQLDDINHKWDEGVKAVGLHSNALEEARREHDRSIKAAHGNADAVKKANETYERQKKHIHESQEAIDQANAARQREIELARQQARVLFEGKLKDWEKDPELANSPNAALADILAQGAALREELLKDAENLGLTSEEVAAYLARIDQATAKHVKALTNQLIAGLGLPLEQARQKAKGMAETMAFLRDRVADGTITAERYAEVVGEAAQQASVDFMTLASSILDTMGATQQSEDLKRQLAEANFLLQIAQLNIMYNALSALGDAGLALQAKLKPILDYINDPSHWPDFSAPTGGSGNISPSNSVNDENPWDALKQLQREVADQIHQWTTVGLGPVAKSASDLKARYEALNAELWRLHGLTSMGLDDIQALGSAYQQAIHSFVNDTLDEFEHFGESDSAKRFRELKKQFDDIAAAFTLIGASADDWARLEVDRAAAFADAWKQATSGVQDLLRSLHEDDPSVKRKDRLRDLQTQFASALAAVQGGDLSKIDEVARLGGLLKDAGAEFYGTASGAYRDMIRQLEASLQGIVDMGPPADIAAASLDVQKSQLDVLQGIFAQLGGTPLAAGGAKVVVPPEYLKTGAMPPDTIGSMSLPRDLRDSLSATVVPPLNELVRLTTSLVLEKRPSQVGLAPGPSPDGQTPGYVPSYGGGHADRLRERDERTEILRAIQESNRLNQKLLDVLASKVDTLRTEAGRRERPH